MKQQSLCTLVVAAVASVFFTAGNLPAQSQQKFQYVNFSQVNITDRFWKPKMDRVATVTIPACIDQTEVKTPRIRNFMKVANKTGEEHEGIYFDDSDVFKALEAIAYSLKSRPDDSLEAKADAWIDVITAAQLPDGYLNTYYSLNGLNKRWTDVEKHEDYIAGHMIEAAVAYYDATGKKKLLNAAIRFADHIDSNFRLANKPWFSGHEEIELALVKLYQVTTNKRYLLLADWYLRQRGKRYYDYNQTWITPPYWQDDKAVYDQTEITGHAVRAMYLYTGAADVGAITGDQQYLAAMQRVWEDVVHRNMYVTGGIGSAGHNEGFTNDFDLPNKSAYCETCASVGMVFWNQRMGQLTGDSKYADVLEKSLYNAALDGVSLSGDRFFYDNPLASTGRHERKAWFGTACCPSNISRLIASLGNYVYAQNGKDLWINLFVGSDTRVSLNGTQVDVISETGYPWTGDVKVTVTPARSTNFAVHLRLPGWARNEAVPGGLYRFADTSANIYSILVNGKPVAAAIDKGYLVINRKWQKGDVISYMLPMEVRAVQAAQQVRQNEGRLALQRGPLVYCLEGIDNGGDAWNLLLNPNLQAVVQPGRILNEEVLAIEVNADKVQPNSNGTAIERTPTRVKAVPYYTWANRGPGNMQVWLPTRILQVQINTIEP